MPKAILIFSLILILPGHLCFSQNPNPDDYRAVLRYLDKERTKNDLSTKEKFDLFLFNSIKSFPDANTTEEKYFAGKKELFKNNFASVIEIVNHIGLANDLGKLLYAELFRELNHFDSALVWVNKVGELPNGLNRYKDNTYLISILKNGLFDEAEQFMKISSSSQKEGAVYFDALLKLDQLDLERSIRLFQIYLKENPLDLEARYWYAYALWSLENPINWRKILNQLNLVVAFNPYHEKSNFLLRQILRKKEKVSDELKESALLIDSLFQENNLKEAEKNLWKLRKEDSTSILVKELFFKRSQKKRLAYLQEIKAPESIADLLNFGSTKTYFDFLQHSKIPDSLIYQLEEAVSFTEHEASDFLEVFGKKPHISSATPSDLLALEGKQKNTLLPQVVRSIYRFCLTSKEKRSIREKYLSYQNKKGMNPWLLGFNELQFLYNIYSAYFNLNHSYFEPSPVLNRAILKSNFPDLFELAKSIFDRSNDPQLFIQNEIQTELSYALLLLEEGKPSEAKYIAQEALKKDSSFYSFDYAKILLENGELDAAENYCYENLKDDLEKSEAYKVLSEIALKKDITDSLKKAESFLTLAVSIEPDPAIGLELSLTLFNYYLNRSDYVSALKISEEFFAPLYRISGNLFPKKNPIFKSSLLKAKMGYGGDFIKELQDETRSDPFDVPMNLEYAKVLEIIQSYTQAARHLEGAQRRFSSFDKLNSSYMLYAASNYLHLGDSITAYYACEPILDGSVKVSYEDRLMLARVFSGVGMQEEANAIVESYKFPGTSYWKSEYFTNKGFIEWYSGNKKKGISFFKKALEFNPYNLLARTELIKQLPYEEASQFLQSALSLPLPPGDIYTKKMYERLSLKKL